MPAPGPAGDVPERQTGRAPREGAIKRAGPVTRPAEQIKAIQAALQTRPPRTSQVAQKLTPDGSKALRSLLRTAQHGMRKLHMASVEKLEHAPAQVNEAIARAQRAVRESVYLPDSSEKTIARTEPAGGPSKTTISGWDGSHDPRYQQGSVGAVRARCAQNGHRLRGSGYLDHGEHGRYAASHAEKAQPPNTPGGVAWPMCRDCIKYWQREATHHKQDQFQADTQMARVFKPGGKIVEYRYDGRVVEVTGRKSVQTRAPDRGGPRAPASAERPARPTSVAAERLANLRTASQSRPISRHWSAAVSHPADFTARTVTRPTGGAARGLTKM